ncbi:hypothetical protein [Streptomyces sp. NPDC054829]|nr:hypothetical protein SBE_005721 [Streptomyces sp. SBE_14.2]
MPGLKERLAALPAKNYNAWPHATLPAVAAEPGALEGILAAIQGLVDGP